MKDAGPRVQFGELLSLQGVLILGLIWERLKWLHLQMMKNEILSLQWDAEFIGFYPYEFFSLNKSLNRHSNGVN